MLSTALSHTTLHCRDQKDQVSSNCASEIFRRQEDAADDFRLDKELYEACKVRRHDRFLVGCTRQNPHQAGSCMCTPEGTQDSSLVTHQVATAAFDPDASQTAQTRRGTTSSLSSL